KLMVTELLTITGPLFDSAAVGATLLTVTTAVSVATWLAPSVTWRVTVIVPLPAWVWLGVRVRVAGGAPSPKPQSNESVPPPPLAVPVKETLDASLAVWSGPAFAVGAPFTVTTVV